MNSPHLGEFAIDLGGKNLILAFTIRAQARIQAVFGDDAGSLQKLLSGTDPEPLVKLLAIGLAKHHPDITEEALLDSVIPIAPLKSALAQALTYAFLGPDAGAKPKGKKAEGEAENPPQPKAT